MTVYISSHMISPYKVVMTCTDCNTSVDIDAPVEVYRLAEMHNQHLDSGKCQELQEKK